MRRGTASADGVQNSLTCTHKTNKAGATTFGGAEARGPRLNPRGSSVGNRGNRNTLALGASLYLSSLLSSSILALSTALHLFGVLLLSRREVILILILQPALELLLIGIIIFGYVHSEEEPHPDVA